MVGGDDASPPVIEVRGLTRRFGKITALDGVDLVVREGDFITVFGPNGAGKTTLIGILSTLVKPTSGEILFAGRSIRNDANRLRRSIGVIEHQSLLYTQLTARENLRFYGRMYGVKDLEGRIERVLEEVHLRHRGDDVSGTYSRGMLQRLSIARAMLHEPSLIFLDEPYSGLDQHSGDRLRDMMARLKARGRTILMTTHNLERGFELSDRHIIMIKGRVMYDKPKEGDRVELLRDVYYRLIAEEEERGT
jgi:heme exporter protein A